MSEQNITRDTSGAAQALALRMRAFLAYFSEDFLGGPRVLKMAWVINFQKAGTFPFLGLLIAWYHNTSTAAWIYLAMHGSYGLVWIVKDLAFPDPSWQHRITIGGGINVFFGVLGWYWVFGWLLISGVSRRRTTRCRTTPGSACASACASWAA